MTRDRVMRRLFPKTSWPYILSHPTAFVVGIIAVFSGLFLLCFPSIATTSSSLGLWLPPIWEQAWPLMHMLGGLALVYGIVYGKPHFEAPGCVFLAATFSCQCIAVLAVRGFDSGFVASATLGSLAMGLAVRCCILTWAAKRGRDVQ